MFLWVAGCNVVCSCLQLTPMWTTSSPSLRTWCRATLWCWTVTPGATPNQACPGSRMEQPWIWVTTVSPSVPLKAALSMAPCCASMTWTTLTVLTTRVWLLTAPTVLTPPCWSASRVSRREGLQPHKRGMELSLTSSSWTWFLLWKKNVLMVFFQSCNCLTGADVEYPVAYFNKEVNPSLAR